jgi:hypothetical protein
MENDPEIWETTNLWKRKRGDGVTRGDLEKRPDAVTR